ncbi:MAG: protein kinase domain-containing protein [Phycisphaerales bacterium]
MSDTTPTTASSPTPPADRGGPVPGDRIGHYTIVRCLGVGGMGAVYEALQDQPARSVAVKVMRSAGTRQERARFRAEAEALGRMNHAAIARVYDAGTAPLVRGGSTADEEPVAYIAMEIVPGATTITRYAGNHRLSLLDRVALLLPVVDALAHAHERGVIHRDLKPGNILVDGDGRARLIDFGIARQARAAIVTTSTAPGQIIGTLAYMSPEQAAAQRGTLDWRTDIYSLGVVLHELATGTLPYELARADALEVARVIRERPPQLATRLDRPGEALPEPLARILLVCLCKQPEGRYTTAAALAADLRAVLEDRPISVQRAGLATRTRAKVRFQAARVPAGATALVCVGAAGVGMVAGVPLADTGAVLTQRVRQAVFGIDTAPPDFRHVRVVAITDSTDTGALARAALMKEPSPASPTALRALHALLLDRLALAGARVIAFDIVFAGPSDADTLLAARADPAPGTGLVLAANAWSAVPAILPGAAVPPKARFGGITINESPEKFFDIELLVHREARPDTEAITLPSLALMSLCQWQTPQLAPGYPAARINGTQLTVRTDADAPPVVVQTSGVLTEDEAGASPERGIYAGDRIAYFPAVIPADEAIGDATVPFQEALSADAATLRSRFGGRIVVIGDHRSGVDRHEYADGRSIAGSVAQAAAIEALVRNFAVQRSFVADMCAALAAAVAGTLAFARTRSRRARGAGVACLAVLTAAAAPCTLAFTGLLLDAPAMLAGMLAGVGLAAWCGLGPRELRTRTQTPEDPEPNP